MHSTSIRAIHSALTQTAHLCVIRRLRTGRLAKSFTVRIPVHSPLRPPSAACKRTHLSTLVADIVRLAIRSWETPTFPSTRGARSSSGRMSECWYPIIAGTRVPSLSASAQCNFTARLALVSVTLDMQCTSLRHNAPTPNQMRPALRLNNSRVRNVCLFNSGLTVIKISSHHCNSSAAALAKARLLS